MVFAGTGRHRRINSKTRKSAAAIAGVAGVGITLPLLTTTGAHAVSLETWDKVAMCESSGNWSIDTGNGFYGGLQFTSSTWAGYGGHAYAPQANLATKNQQITIAEKVLAGQGPGAWPVCGPQAGLTKGGPAPQLDTTPTPQQPAPQQSTPGITASGDGSSNGQVQTASPTSEDAGRGRGYRVVAGDTLSKIARKQHVEGDWHTLYKINRSVVGSNPDRICPGQELTLDGTAASPATAVDQPAPQTAAPAAPQASTVSSSSGYVAPVQARITTGYHVPGPWASGYHTGVDLAVPTGTSVKAITAGIVVFAGWGGAYGNQVVIEHPDGKYSQYAHLSALNVATGQGVTAAQQIGLSGATGNATGPHLHFEIRTTPDYGTDTDPTTYLAAHGITL